MHTHFSYLAAMGIQPLQLKKQYRKDELEHQFDQQLLADIQISLEAVGLATEVYIDALQPPHFNEQQLLIPTTVLSPEDKKQLWQTISIYSGNKNGV